MFARPNLTPLLNPQSIAIVGVSQLPRFGGQVYQNLLTLGYSGRIYGVNPRYTTLFDQPCYPALSALPEVPDCVFLALANERLLPALQEAAELGVKAAVISASAHSDPVDGQPTLQQELARVAHESGLALCGPNCMGLISFRHKFCAAGYAIEALPAGNITFISHSGSAFDAIWQNTRDLRFNHLISSGNEISVTLADYMHYALADPTTRVLGLFLETVRDPANFRAALAEAAERDIPIVALKVGGSQAGAKLAQAHSGALAGTDAAYDALFAQYGVRRVQNMDELLDTLELFAAGIRPATNAIVSIHDSGGERGHFVDLADSEGVQFASLTPVTTARLAEQLDPGLAPINPLDAWGTGLNFGPLYLNCMLALDAEPGTGLNVWAADLYPSGTVSSTYVDLAIEYKDRFTKPLCFLSNLAGVADPMLAAKLRAAGIPVLLGTENGLRAIRHLLAYCEFQRQRGTQTFEEPKFNTEQVVIFRNRLRSAAGALDEFASKNMLRAYGLTTAPEAIAGSLSAAQNAAKSISYPVALKTAAGELHKSDRGGVYLNLADPAALATAYANLQSAFGPRVLVQKMISGGVELILGLVNDPQFGLLLTLGLGGIFVEVLRDAKVLALPVSADQVRAALLSLKGAPLLQGARGRPPVDVEAVVAAALGLAALGRDLGDEIDSLDINPLIALPDAAVVVDALIIPKHPAEPTSQLPHTSGHEEQIEESHPNASSRLLSLYECAVQANWIDYNGHMTEAAYLTAFGDASDALFRYVGIDEAYRAAGHSFYTVETHINYYQEVRLGEPLRFTTQLLGLDEKRLHIFHRMTHGATGDLLATTEQLLVHVDMAAAAATPILPKVYTVLSAILAAQRALPVPKQAGRQIKLRR